MNAPLEHAMRQIESARAPAKAVARRQPARNRRSPVKLSRPQCLLTKLFPSADMTIQSVVPSDHAASYKRAFLSRHLHLPSGPELAFAVPSALNSQIPPFD